MLHGDKYVDIIEHMHISYAYCISWSLCSLGNMLFRCDLFAIKTSSSFPTFIQNRDAARGETILPNFQDATKYKSDQNKRKYKTEWQKKLAHSKAYGIKNRK